MSARLTLDSLAAATPDGRPLFDNLTIAFGAERTGIVGRNGAGKSTLLRILAGAVPPAAGAVTATGTVGMLEQLGPADGVTVAEALGVAEGLMRLRRLAAGDGTAEDAGAAEWDLDDRIDDALTTAHLPGLALDRPLAGLSGGERTRLAIARLLLSRPGLLLLDEPTNNLDEAGRDAVAALVRGWRGGIVAASHDRALLALMDRILELSPTGVRLVGGGWDEFTAWRDAARDRAAAELDRARAALRETGRAIQQQAERRARRDRAGRADHLSGSQGKLLMDYRQNRAEQSAGKERRLAERLQGDAAGRLAEAEAQVERATPLHIDLPRCGLPAGREVLAADGLVAVRGGRILFGPLSFTVTGPERIALTGPNGAGKSTLMTILAGLAPPDGGSLWHGPGTVALLDQHAGRLDPSQSILDNLRRLQPALSDQAARALLARFAFRNAQALVAARTLSGGERMRAALACAAGGAQPPSLLLLDEPTNHLDLEAVELLEGALRGYDGALIVVSHDRRFLEAIGVTREIALG